MPCRLSKQPHALRCKCVEISDLSARNKRKSDVKAERKIFCNEIPQPRFTQSQPGFHNECYQCHFQLLLTTSNPKTAFPDRHRKSRASRWFTLFIYVSSSWKLACLENQEQSNTERSHKHSESCLVLHSPTRNHCMNILSNSCACRWVDEVASRFMGSHVRFSRKGIKTHLKSRHTGLREHLTYEQHLALDALWRWLQVKGKRWVDGRFGWRKLLYLLILRRLRRLLTGRRGLARVGELRQLVPYHC